MIGVDTNVVVRLLTRDDEEQFQQAATLFAQNDIFIPTTVILETEWVLRYSYGFARESILDAFAKTFGLPNVKIQHHEAMALAIELTCQGLDFADALHLSFCQECNRFTTFDTTFIKSAKGRTKRKVKQP